MSTHNSQTVAPMLANSQALHHPIQQTAPGQMQSDEVDLREYFNILFDNRRMIALFVLVSVILGASYAFLVKPTYEASMLIHVEESNPATPNSVLSELAAPFETKMPVTGEVELLHSRMVISGAVENLRLYIDTSPKYFPVFGAWIARHNAHLSEPGLFGYGGYVWGTEKMDVAIFKVPDALQNREFLIRAEAGGKFRITGNDQGLDLTGTVGTPLTVNTENGKIDLLISKIVGRPGAEFVLTSIPRLTAIEKLQKAMVIGEQGKQSAVIGITLQGKDPQLISRILDEVGRTYVEQNLARKTAEAKKSLAILDAQLPELKLQLEQSEARLSGFRNLHGTIDLGEEAKLSLQQSASAKARRLELLQRKTELLTRYTPEHPALVGIQSQLREIEHEINTVAGHIKTLPVIQQDLVRLTRDVKVNTDMYAAYSNAAQQLRMNTVGKVSNVRLVDPPMAPQDPIKPNRLLIVALSAITALFLAVIGAVIEKYAFGGIESPEKIEKMLGARVVYATIPHSQYQATLSRKMATSDEPVPVLAQVAPDDIAIESMRSFRAALQFAMPRYKNNIVIITGPTQGLGKSFVSVNFAAVVAASGKKVLMIDADLRNGHLHQYFGIDRRSGLSESITGTRRLEQTIHRDVIQNLDFMSTGLLPANPSELLLHKNFAALLEAVSNNYDFVLIDPPPVLAVSDTLIIGAHAGAVFLLTRAGVTKEGEISEAIKRLNQTGIEVQGVLFNDLVLRPGAYGYHYDYPYASKNISRIEYAS